MPLTPHRDLPFLHRLQERGLRLGRSPVDLVGEYDVGKDRPSQELELPNAGGLIFLNNLGAGDVRRHQVGCELDAVIAQIQGIGHRMDHQRLGQARNADQQTMSAGEDGDQELFQDRVLTHDHLGHLGLKFGERILQTLDGGEIIFALKGFDRVCVAHACLPVADKGFDG